MTTRELALLAHDYLLAAQRARPHVQPWHDEARRLEYRLRHAVTDVLNGESLLGWDEGERWCGAEEVYREGQAAD